MFCIPIFSSDSDLVVESDVECMDLHDSDPGDSSSLYSSDSECHDKEWRVLAIGVETADPICVKLNELIRRGRVPKDRIFYKFMKDVVEFYYDPQHKYDDDVVEFFNTITYLGGRRTSNMIRGPMFANLGRGCQHSEEPKMNLGGPSEETCRIKQAGYTVTSGVHKSLLKSFTKLAHEGSHATR